MIDAAAVAFDHVGNLIVADFDANAIRVVVVRSGTFYGRPMTAGDIYTVAGTGPVSSVCGSFAGDGGPATATTLCQPNAIAVDNNGNLLVSDSGLNRVRAVAVKTGMFYGQAMTAGDIYTIAGSGKAGLGGDGGPAAKAGLVLTPGAGLAVDCRGEPDDDRGSLGTDGRREDAVCSSMPPQDDVSARQGYWAQLTYRVQT